MNNYTDKPHVTDTPDDIADQMVQLADLKPFHSILEPSAGRGAIVRAIFKTNPEFGKVHICERNDKNWDLLFAEFQTAIILGEKDMLRIDETNRSYDRIIMCPPYRNFADVLHVQKAYRLLKRGGKLVALIYNDFKTGNAFQYKKFREWLATVPHKAFIVDKSNVIPPNISIILVIDNG